VQSRAAISLLEASRVFTALSFRNSMGMPSTRLPPAATTRSMIGAAVSLLKTGRKFP
jgi:hypothetical protein